MPMSNSKTKLSHRIPQAVRNLRERRRQRAYAQEKIGKSDWKNWGGLLISTFALIISGVTAYHGIFYRSDDLRLSIDLPSLFYDHATESIRIGIPRVATLINAGNRSIAVTRAQIYFVQPIAGHRTPNCDENGHFQYVTHTPERLVVQPSQIASLVMHNDDNNGSDKISISEENKKRDNGIFQVISCAMFSVVLSDGAAVRITLPLSDTEVDPSALPGVGGVSRYLFDPTRPLILLKH